MNASVVSGLIKYHEARLKRATGRDALANLSFREIQKFATIHVSSELVRESRLKELCHD